MIKFFFRCGLFAFVLISILSCAPALTAEMDRSRYEREPEFPPTEKTMTVGLFFEYDSTMDSYIWISDAQDTPKVEEIVVPSSFYGENGNRLVKGIKGCGEVDIIATDVFLPDTISMIKEKAFYKAKFLEKIETNAVITAIEKEAFYGCVLFNQPELISNIKRIEESSFEGCSSLVLEKIPESVEVIEKRAFANCRGLTSIRIGANVKEIGLEAFNLCSNLKNIYCAAPSKPTEWDESWLGNCSATVLWGQ